MRKLVGLIAVAIGIVMFITLFPTLVDNFKYIWENTTGLWNQIKSLVSALWNFVFQPFVLVLLGLIALEPK